MSPDDTPEEAMEDDELLTVVEVARWLRITPRTVYRFVHHAQLPHIRVGRGLRFKRADVEAWLRRHAEG
jgi:PTS system nitrogen regulatory IIA component